MGGIDAVMPLNSKMRGPFCTGLALSLAVLGACASPAPAFAEEEIAFDGGGVAMSGRGAVLDAGTGEAYSSLAEAVAAAAPGATLQLIDDCALDAPLAIGTALTLDLAGHCLSCGSSASPAPVATVLAVEGAGCLTVTDTSAKAGSLACHLGSSRDRAGTTYDIIKVGAKASLHIERASLSVTYGGRPADSERSVAVGGILAEGAVTLESGASLRVEGAKRADAVGAATVYGIKAQGNADVAIAEDVSVEAEANGEPAVVGSDSYPEIAGDGSERGSLIEVAIGPESTGEEKKLYDEVAQAFLERARLDSDIEEGNEQWNANLYWLNACRLPCGVTVWAYSDVVEKADQGWHKFIVPRHIFVRSPHVVPQTAAALTAAEDFAGSVRAAGSLTARCKAGRAFCLLKAEKGAYRIEEGSCDAEVARPSYRALQGPLDLSQVIDLAPGLSGVQYPKSDKYRDAYRLVAEVRSQAGAIGELGAADSVVERSSEGFRAAWPATAETVSVTCRGLFDAEGNPAGDVVLKVPYGDTLEEAKASLPRPADYEKDGKTYRFVGWVTEALADAATPYCRDGRSLSRDLAFDARVQGAPQGSTSLTARYVAVGAGEHLFTYAVDHGIVACAAKSAKDASFAKAFNDSSKDKPEPLADKTGYTRTFERWAEQKGALMGDVSYRAVFKETAKSVTVRLSAWQIFEGSSAFRVSDARTTDWDKDYGSQAAMVAKAGDCVASEGVLYRFLGWSTRSSDKEPVFTDRLPLRWVSSSRLSDSVHYYGVYESQAQMLSVRFYVGGQLYASTDSLPATTTLYDAFAKHSDRPVEPTSADPECRFRGWATDPGATRPLYANIVKLYDLAAKDGVVTVHALWRTPDAPAAEDGPADSSQEKKPTAARTGKTRPVAARSGKAAPRTVAPAAGRRALRANAAAEAPDEPSAIETAPPMPEEGEDLPATGHGVVSEEDVPASPVAPDGDRTGFVSTCAVATAAVALGLRRAVRRRASDELPSEEDWEAEPQVVHF